VLFGIDKVTKYHLEAALYSTGFVWVMNKRAYAAMSTLQQNVIDAHCNREWAEKIAAPWADFEHMGIAKLKTEPGHEVNALTNTQLDQWKSCGRSGGANVVCCGEQGGKQSRRSPDRP